MTFHFHRGLSWAKIGFNFAARLTRREFLAYIYIENLKSHISRGRFQAFF